MRGTGGTVLSLPAAFYIFVNKTQMVPRRGMNTPFDSLKICTIRKKQL